MPSFRRLAPLLVVPAFLAGCDAVASIAGIDKFDVSTGSAATLDLAPDATVTSAASININQDLPDVFSVERISVPADAVTYTPAGAAVGSASGRGAAATCSVHFYVMVDEVPAVQGSVTVDEEANPQVQDLATQYAQPYDRGAICSGLGGGCPVTTDELSGAAIRDHVDAAVQRGRFALDVVAHNDGPCGGVFAIEQLHFDLDF